jgi:hypothetical protein
MKLTKNKKKMLGVYLDIDDVKWLHFHSFAIGKTKSRIIEQAFKDYRQRIEESHWKKNISVSV